MNGSPVDLGVLAITEVMLLEGEKGLKMKSCVLDQETCSYKGGRYKSGFLVIASWDYK